MSSIETPLVSICSITYNHEPYIRQCLDGMLSQKTNFPFEIIINDDCSTDGTTEIIKEYVAKYPNIIRPIFHEENQYSKGVRGIFANFCFPKARGKYIALCEGDDYWTDPLKLQKQVDFLEKTPEYVLCTHHYKLLWQENDSFVGIEPRTSTDLHYDLDYFVTYNWVTAPLTSIFRKSILNQKYYKYKYSKDVTLFYYLLKHGKGYLMKDNMAVYRMHNGGVYSGSDDAARIKADLNTMISIYEIEKNRQSALLINNYLNHVGYIGLRFIAHNLSLYFQVCLALLTHLEINQALPTIIKTFNFITRYFMIISNKLKFFLN